MSRSIVDYARSLDCIHCGLCLHTCPTYQLTGREASSPRGRVHLMRAVAEERIEADAAFQDEMDFCLVCRHCESACPAGVEFGAMMEFTRDRLKKVRPPSGRARFLRWLGFRVVLPRRGLLRLAALATRLAQRTGLLRIAAPLVGMSAESAAALPEVPPRAERRRLPAVTRADGERRETASVLEGCVMPELFGRANRATVRCMAAAGVEVHSPAGHTCCGALHAHNGEMDVARRLAHGTIEAFEAVEGPVVVNSAGCGAHMKEYARVLAEDPEWLPRARTFAARVVDFSEYLAPRLDRLALRETALRVTWDDPCHLCHGQQLREPPRVVLDRVPGVERVELPRSESCCGSAGIYSLLRPADSARVLAEKVADFEETGAGVLVTGNPGCQMQWMAGLAGKDVRVMHVAEVVARALGD